MLSSRFFWKHVVTTTILVCLALALGLHFAGAVPAQPANAWYERALVQLWWVLPAVFAAAGVSGWWWHRERRRQVGRAVEVLERLGSQTEAPQLRPAGDRDWRGLVNAFNVASERLTNKLRASEAERAELRSILRSMDEGVIAVDRDERIVHINGVATALLGGDASSAHGRPIWEVTRQRPICEAVTEAIRSSQRLTGELSDAEVAAGRVIQFHAAPMFGRGGVRGGAVVVMHDISDLRRLETMRRDFVANVSHELKTPLAAIRGLVETVIDDTEMDGPTRDRFVRRIAEQSHRLSSLVTDLLTLSRLEAPSKSRLDEVVDLRQVCVECALSVQNTAEDKDVTLERQWSDHPVIVLGDPEALALLVDNLLINAVQYTPEGGSVALKLVAGDGDAVIEVRDSGIGIDLRDQERVFERFYRVDKARSRALGGTGLGLSIVKHTALTHGGSVGLESALGQGSTFRVRLPLAPLGNVPVHESKSL